MRSKHIQDIEDFTRIKSIEIFDNKDNRALKANVSNFEFAGVTKYAYDVVY